MFSASNRIAEEHNKSKSDEAENLDIDSEMFGELKADIYEKMELQRQHVNEQIRQAL